jgi:hypothetical protein
VFSQYTILFSQEQHSTVFSKNQKSTYSTVFSQDSILFSQVQYSSVFSQEQHSLAVVSQEQHIRKGSAKSSTARKVQLRAAQHSVQPPAAQ